MSHRQKWFTIIYCGTISAIGAIAVDTSLPLLGVMAADLQVPLADMPLIITLFVWTVGIGQGLWGFAADRFGRKPVIFVGLIFFFAGSVLATIAPSFSFLLLARLLQGFGAAIGPVLSRTILRDCFSGKELAQSIAIATAIFAIGPIFSPFLSAYIAELTSWKAVFFILTVFSVLLFITTLFLHETIPQKQPHATHPRHVAKITKLIFSTPQSSFFTIITSFIWTCFLIILANLPRFFDELFHIAGKEFALLFALVGIAILVGQIINHRLLQLLSPQVIALIAVAIMAISAAAVLTLVYLNFVSPTILLLFMISFAFFYPMLLVVATALTLEPHDNVAGAVSSLFGFFYQSTAAATASILSLFHFNLTQWLVFIFITITACTIALFIYNFPIRKFPIRFSRKNF